MPHFCSNSSEWSFIVYLDTARFFFMRAFSRSSWFFKLFPYVTVLFSESKLTVVIITNMALVKEERGKSLPDVVTRTYWDYDAQFLNDNLTIAHESWASLFPRKFKSTWFVHRQLTTHHVSGWRTGSSHRSRGGQIAIAQIKSRVERALQTHLSCCCLSSTSLSCKSSVCREVAKLTC